MWNPEFWNKWVDIIKPIETEIKEKNNPILENVKVEWYGGLYNKIMWLFSDNELIWGIKDYIDEWYPITQNWINELLENFWVDWISRSHVVRGNASFLNSNIV